MNGRVNPSYILRNYLLEEAIKKLARPTTALTRRKELTINLPLPRECYRSSISCRR